MGERVAVYPGTFDPPTNGHLDVMKRASKLFDKLIVAIAENPDKKPLFTVAERIKMIKELTQNIPNVEVVAFNGLTVELCRRHNAVCIVRGIRTFSDYEYEFQMALTNRSLAPDIETIFIMPSEEFSFLSSSMVKQAVSLGGDLSQFIPQIVLRCLKQKLKQTK
ncbi:MAG: pantetheine-phosphate adenylyltransferase [Planctomycetota bacterium]|nr:pantetheine-phosphate adenylyltransferase [Planctomycetota bacterium]